MAKAPTPGASSQAETQSAIFTLTDGRRVTCDVRTLTMAERRAAKTELKRLDDPDELEAMVAALWIIMRRDEPELDFMDLMEQVTIGTLQDGEVPEQEATADDPSQ